MRSIANLRPGLAGFIFIATARVVFAVDCGDTITTDETLSADLNCSADPALTIGDGGSLDLNGFKVTCTGSGTTGIRMTAEGTSVSNGAVGNCNYGISLEGTKHKITGVYVFNSVIYGIHSNNTTAGSKIKDSAVSGGSTCLYLQSSNNTITGVSVRGCINTGIYLAFGGNKLKDVTIRDSGLYGLKSSGPGDKVSNILIVNANFGVHSTASDSKYSNVHSFEHTNNGFFIAGNDNKLLGSTFIGQPGTVGIDGGGAMGNTVGKCATLGGQYGIRLSGGTDVSKNRIFASSLYGLSAVSGGSSISKNVGLGSVVFDFYESSPGCASGNEWSGNIGRRNDACIE